MDGVGVVAAAHSYWHVLHLDWRWFVSVSLCLVLTVSAGVSTTSGSSTSLAAYPRSTAVFPSSVPKISS